LTNEELVRIKAPQVWTLFWSYFSVVIGVGLFTLLFFREDRPDLHLFLNEISILATTCVFGWIYRKSLIVQFKKIGFDSHYAYIALALLVPLLALNYFYSEMLMELTKDKHADLLSKLREFGIRESSLIATFCVFPAVLEEIAYRGLAQHWLQTAIAPKRAILLASTLFAATHMSLLSFPYLLLVGLLLGWAKYKTGSLYPSMLIHFLHNFVVIEFFSGG
jgi:membrane protease YdiL (CAAX protease family)